MLKPSPSPRGGVGALEDASEQTRQHLGVPRANAKGQFAVRVQPLLQPGLRRPPRLGQVAFGISATGTPARLSLDPPRLLVVLEGGGLNAPGEHGPPQRGQRRGAQRLVAVHDVMDAGKPAKHPVHHQKVGQLGIGRVDEQAVAADVGQAVRRYGEPVQLNLVQMLHGVPSSQPKGEVAVPVRLVNVRASAGRQEERVRRKDVVAAHIGQLRNRHDPPQCLVARDFPEALQRSLQNVGLHPHGLGRLHEARVQQLGVAPGEVVPQPRRAALRSRRS